MSPLKKEPNNQAIARTSSVFVPVIEHDLASFSAMLEAWEAAENFLMLQSPEPPTLAETAALLGWTIPPEDGSRRVKPKPTATAKATAAALNLIRGGYNTHADFEGLPVAAGNEIAIQAQYLMNNFDGPYRTITAERIEEGKKRIGVAVAKTAQDFIKGDVPRNRLRIALDKNIYQFAREAERKPPVKLSFEFFLSPER
jgi:hypothetical protein